MRRILLKPLQHQLIQHVFYGTSLEEQLALLQAEDARPRSVISRSLTSKCSMSV